MPSHEEKVMEVFDRLGAVLKIPGIKLVFMRPDRQINRQSGYVEGTASLGKRIITVDIYTPKFRKPKSLNGIIRVLAHEFAHYQKPPYRQRYRGHIITRQHYPAFYRQVTKNINRIKRDKALREYFR